MSSETHKLANREGELGKPRNEEATKWKKNGKDASRKYDSEKEVSGRRIASIEREADTLGKQDLSVVAADPTNQPAPTICSPALIVWYALAAVSAAIVATFNYAGAAVLGWVPE